MNTLRKANFPGHLRHFEKKLIQGCRVAWKSLTKDIFKIYLLPWRYLTHEKVATLL